MVLSMTGFASKTTTITLTDGSKVNISINLKTLNSRFFETTCKLSYSINHLETELIKIMRPHIVRGHAYLTMHVLNPQALHGSVTPSVTTIEGYVQAINKIKKDVSVQGTLTVSDLIRLPDIFEVEEKEIDKDFKQQIFKIVNELAKQVTKTREREGAELKKDLLLRFKTIKKEIEQIETAAKKLMTAKKKEVAQAIKEMTESPDETADSRKSALYIALDKMDVHEEIVRFKSHLENIITQIDSKKVEKGKRLDFTLQELAREINTLSAKCSDASITTQSINIKVELEKSREQTQNIV